PSFQALCRVPRNGAIRAYARDLRHGCHDTFMGVRPKVTITRQPGPMNALTKPTTRYRAIFISDIHMGTRRAQVQYLLDFLRVTESDWLYIVGDLIDNWALEKAWFWDQLHNDLIQKILRKARKGTKVIYIPGNHDDKFRDFRNLRMGRV